MKLWPLFFVGLFSILLYILYRQGMAVSRSILAVLHIFRPGKDADRVMLDSCTGWDRHVGRFHESRTYEFVFDAQLSKGDVDVTLLDGEKQPLLKLNRQSPAGRVELDGKGRYYLCWNYRNATGKCQLRW